MFRASLVYRRIDDPRNSIWDDDFPIFVFSDILAIFQKIAEDTRRILLHDVLRCVIIIRLDTAKTSSLCFKTGREEGTGKDGRRHKIRRRRTESQAIEKQQKAGNQI